MSRKVGNASFIYPENSQECDDCGGIKELRPYGPNYSMICHDCAMKDPAGTEVRMAKKLFGDNITRDEAQGRLDRRNNA